MGRPEVTVVMPFAGDEAEAQAAEAALLALGTEPGDALILSDNTGTAARVEVLIVVRADGERSPARARNAGAALARTDWILFIDADCVAPPELLDAYFEAEIAPDVGALAGVSAIPVTRGSQRMREPPGRRPGCSAMPCRPFPHRRSFSTRLGP